METSFANSEYYMSSTMMCMKCHNKIGKDIISCGINRYPRDISNTSEYNIYVETYNRGSYRNFEYGSC